MLDECCQADKSRRDISILSWKPHGRAKELATACAPLSLHSPQFFFIRVGFGRWRLASNYAPPAGSEIRVFASSWNRSCPGVLFFVFFFFFILSARKGVTRNFPCLRCRVFVRVVYQPRAKFLFSPLCPLSVGSAESRHLKLITSTKFAASALRRITRNLCRG